MEAGAMRRAQRASPPRRFTLLSHGPS